MQRCSLAGLGALGQNPRPAKSPTRSGALQSTVHPCQELHALAEQQTHAGALVSEGVGEYYS
jgi:hypothetical protein